MLKIRLFVLLIFLSIIYYLLLLHKSNEYNNFNLQLTNENLNNFNGKQFAILISCMVDNATKCGECDFNAMIKILRKNGFADNNMSTLLVKTRQTHEASDSLFSLLKKLSQLNLSKLIFFYSGHGSSKSDIDSIDEMDDQKDEYLDLDAASIRDDSLFIMFSKFINTKIVFITACCNSATNYKFTEDNMEQSWSKINELQNICESDQTLYPQLLHIGLANDLSTTPCIYVWVSDFVKDLVKVFSKKSIIREICIELQKFKGGYLCNTYEDVEKLSFYNEKIFN